MQLLLQCSMLFPYGTLSLLDDLVASDSAVGPVSQSDNRIFHGATQSPNYIRFTNDRRSCVTGFSFSVFSSSAFFR